MSLQAFDLSYKIFAAKNENRIILRGINLSICPGDMCALMGASGAGKRYFIKHLYRFMHDIFDSECLPLTTIAMIYQDAYWQLHTPAQVCITVVFIFVQKTNHFKT